MGGGVDFSRLMEQLIPTVAVGAFVLYGNAQIVSNQVAELRKDMDRTVQYQQSLQIQNNSQSLELTRIAAQLTAFVEQQNKLNSTMDSRMTYLERKDR